jgi:LPXTG-motif cell wall-anchored protein
MRAAAPVDPDAARRAAQRILSDRRFRASPTPRPLRGPLHWLGDRLDALFGPVAALIASVSAWIWLAALGIVVAAIAWIVTRRRRRRLTTAPTGKAPRVAATDTDPEDPDALERAADAAERDGDLARAVRLRFRAGLLRLGDRGAIRYRPSVTTGEVRTTLRSQRFDDLAGTFEAVAYGGRAADRPDIDASRREWPHVLEEAGRP